MTAPTATDDARPRRPAGGRGRLRLALVALAVGGALALLLAQGLGSATTYFRNADEAAAERDDLGTSRFRLQGTVVPGSVAQEGDTVTFAVEYRCATVPVRHRGDPHELFRPGIPVVLEGAFAPAGSAFESDTMIVRHTSEYRVEESERLEQAADEACPA